MGQTILVTGGARSGKSAIAERRALGLGAHAVYIATAQAFDDEMAERIALHQSRRGPEWTTVAEPVELARALRKTDGQGPRMVDCLTLWLTNLILQDADWNEALDGLLATVPALRDPVVFVTNEVGSGIVPENALARSFRDAAGIVNQRVAAVADEVILAVAGLPLRVR
jgi:adenosylcobinamide kinase/adenosylcobinamide-phosphate guanylyltransferase